MTIDSGRAVPDHYDAGYIHWDLVVVLGLGYLDGNATKYVTRWRKKNGVDDLQKALHYVRKLSVEKTGRFRVASFTTVELEVARFAQANGLTDLERQIILDIATWKTGADLVSVADRLIRMMEEFDRASASHGVKPAEPVPVEDSNRHAERAS